MKFVDKLLQKLRIVQARKYLKKGFRVLDIGSDDGALFKQIPWISGIGVDPIAVPLKHKRFEIKQGYFPQAIPKEQFDAITLLAVIEHVPYPDLEKLAKNMYSYLKKGGRIIITVPSKRVDDILAILQFFKLVDGMKLEEHHGYQVSRTPHIFKQYKLRKHKTFELGLNHLFVFEK
jgi:SAM-dependent methyltransferase